MKHLIIFLLTLITLTTSAQITNNTAWYKFAQKITVGGKLQIPNDTLTLTAQDTGLVAIVGDKFYIAAVIGGTLQWGEVVSGGGGGIAAGDTTAMLANYFNQAIRSGDSIIFYNSGVRLAGVYSPITGGAVWGGITGDPSDQADLQALLDAKQATLVSGTNIKTINGTTLLGSGNLSVTGAAQSKNITIETPSAAENITIFYTTVAITVTHLADVVKGTSPSLTYNIQHATARDSGSPNNLLGSSRTTTSTAGSTTTTFSDATIPAGSWVWIVTSAIGAATTEAAINLTYTVD